MPRHCQAASALDRCEHVARHYNGQFIRGRAYGRQNCIDLDPEFRLLSSHSRANLCRSCGIFGRRTAHYNLLPITKHGIVKIVPIQQTIVFNYPQLWLISIWNGMYRDTATLLVECDQL